MPLTDGVLTGIAEDYPDYLRDESRRTGEADSISFPKTEEDVIAQLGHAAAANLPVTVQGARTGITGGAVPEGGHIVNLSQMNRCLHLRQADGDDFILTVQPGLLLSELRQAVADKAFGWDEEAPPPSRLHGGDPTALAAARTAALAALRAAGDVFFPPDPTETGAAIGGMVACNASGAQSFLYGPTRRYVEGLRVILADGSPVRLHRGSERATGREFSFSTDNGRPVRGRLPSYRMPGVKSAAGYFAQDDMDLVDLFVGAEGTLGVITEIDLRLVPAPAARWGVTAFFPSEACAIDFVEKGRGREGACRPAAIEFFDANALNLLRRQKRENPAFGELPDMDPAWHTAVYVEYHGASDDVLEDAVMGMSELMVEAGGDEDATWLASDSREMSRLKDFRHAVPEAVNLMIDERRKSEPTLTKLGTDLAVPDGSLAAVLRLYHDGLAAAGLDYVMFGHIGDNHVHVNIIPEDLDAYRRGKALYQEWARAVVALGGTVSAEHGIGKLKKTLLREMVGDKGIAEMAALKTVLDPDGRLNPGNLF